MCCRVEIAEEMCLCSEAECAYCTVLGNEMETCLTLQLYVKYGLCLCLVLFKELPKSSFKAVEVYATDLCSTWGQYDKTCVQGWVFFQNVAENICQKV